MKKHIVFLANFLFIVFSVCFITITTATAEDFVHQYYVDAHDHSTAYQYLDTGIDIVGGTKLQINASGTACYAGANTSYCFGPDGNPQGEIIGGIRAGSLVGKIGDSEKFLIGSDYQDVIVTSGRFFLGYNDSDYLNNSKGFEVSVTLVSSSYNCDEDDTGSIDITGGNGPCGGKVSISVRIQNAPNALNSIGFDVAFDSGVLAYIGFEKGELAEQFDYFNISGISEELVRCGGFAAEELAEGSEGDLVYLQFDVSDTCHDSKLALRDLKDDIATWTASHGCFGMKCAGDINKDGEITPKDALCAFEKYLEVCPTSCAVPCDEVCCDANADGECTPADGLCIFRKYLGIPGCLDF